MSSKPKSPNGFIKYAGLVSYMGLIIGSGTFGGKWLDSHFGYNYLFTITFSLLSIFIALYLVLKSLIQKPK